MECEICGKDKLFLEKHHIHSKSLGGSNKPYNITNICPDCHKLIHSGIIILEGKYNSTKGVVLVWRYFIDEPLFNNISKCWLKENHKEAQQQWRLKNDK